MEGMLSTLSIALPGTILEGEGRAAGFRSSMVQRMIPPVGGLTSAFSGRDLRTVVLGNADEQTTHNQAGHSEVVAGLCVRSRFVPYIHLVVS